MRKAAVSLALTLIVSTFAGCTASDNTNSENAAAIANVNSEAEKTNTNVEQLGVLISIPYESEEALWRQSTDKKRVIAVLRLSGGEAKRLVEDAARIAQPQPVLVSNETWFPPELIAQGGMSGEDMLKGEAFPANAFFQEPYTGGRVTRVENTDYFILELSSK